MFNFGTVKRLVLPLNVGQRNGQTFIGGINDSGDHWVLVVVELRLFKRILYCDTLAGKPPSNIIDVVNSYTSHIPRVGMYDEKHLFLAHDPMATSRLGHVCDWRCRNYPLQTCSDICGVIVLITAAVAALDRTLFQYLIGPFERGEIYLQRPSQHAYYLRRILMSWFAESRIEINYVLLHPGWRDDIPTKSDHTFCLRRDTSSNTKKRLNLSLNHKASSFTGSTLKAPQGHASSKENTSLYSTEASATKNEASKSSSSNPNSPLSAEGKLSPPPKTSSTANDPRATPSSYKKRSFVGIPSASERPPKVARSTPEETSSGKKPQSYSCPDPSRATSPIHNNGPPANPVKSASTDQPSPSAEPRAPAPAPAQTQPTSLGEIVNDSSPSDSAGSVFSPNCEGLSRFQCEHCGMKLSSRNCLYKHKQNDRVDKATGSKHVICPECKEQQQTR